MLTLFMLLMVIGAAPGGTGGGVKLTTLTTLLAVMRARLRGRVRIELMGRRVASERVTLAATLLFSHLLFIAGVLFLLTLVEDRRFLPLAFETVSAMGTVGLSMGVTPELSAWGCGLIMLTMLVGRLRTLTFGLALLEDTGPGDREREKEAEEERARREERDEGAGADEGDGAKEDDRADDEGDGAEEGDGADDDEDDGADEDDLAI